MILAGGTELPSDVTVWAAGCRAPAELASWGLPQGRGGRIVVGPDLRVRGQDRIFAARRHRADRRPAAAAAGPAGAADRAARGRADPRLAAGQPAVPFQYHDKGIMATIGRRSAVVELPRRIRVRGTLAWLAWLALHLVTLLGHRNRMSALLNLS